MTQLNSLAGLPYAELARLLDQLPDGVAISAGDGTIVLANAAFATIVGRDVECLVGQSVTADFHPGERADTSARLVESQPGVPLRTTGRVVRPDGETRKVDLLGSKLASGRILAVVRDITGAEAERRAMDAEQAKLRAAVEAGLDAWFILDAVRDAAGAVVDFVYADLNAVGEAFIGRPLEAVIGDRLTHLLPEDSAEVARLAAVLEEGEPVSETFTSSVAAYAGRRFHRHIVPVGDSVALVIRDETERRRMEEALSASETAQRELLAALPVIVYSVSPEPPFAPTYVSPGVEALGYTLEEWLAQPDMWLRTIHPDDRPRILAETEAALASHAAVEYEYRVMTRSGEVRWMHDCGQFVRDERERAVAWRGVMVDITERRTLQNQLAALSDEDDLTQLLNRRGFRRMAEQALKVEHRSGRSIALVYFDVDHFKAINDTFGHAAGDHALRVVAHALRDGVREGDLVARFGGDEFVLLAVGIDPPGEGDRLARRLCGFVAKQNMAVSGEPPRYKIELSYGAVEDDGGTSLDTLLNRADAALYATRLARRGPARGEPR